MSDNIISIEDIAIDTLSLSLQTVYQRKIALMEELLICLGAERDDLIHWNIGNIREAESKKQDLLRDIEFAIEQLKSMKQLTPKERWNKTLQQNKVTKYRATDQQIREEMVASTRKNVSIIKASMAFIEEIRGRLFSNHRHKTTYDRSGTHHSGSHPAHFLGSV